LEKDGWRITDDPYTIEFEDLRVWADLGAEKIFAAEREGRKIVVEVKVFGAISLVNDFEKALGQYNLYRSVLKLTDTDRELFLAVADEVYERFFRRASIQAIIADQQVKLFVFAPATEEILQWIN
jgi:hypothetical protein